MAGDVITELTENLPEMSGTFVAGLISANLYYQMLPYKALVYSFVFLGLYFYLMGLIMMTPKLLGHRIVGFVIAGTILTLGSALAQFELKIEWILPAAHSIVKNHFSTYYRAMKCPLQTSVIYFTIMICILSVVSYYFVRKFDYVKMNEL